MLRFDRCFCPQCGKQHYGAGRLGTSQQCCCGGWIPRAALDRVRRYWIIQIAISFGLASFFFALAIFYRDLPNNHWERLFSPTLQAPAIASFIVSYRSLIRHKKSNGSDDLVFRYFIWGISVMSIAIITALLVAVSDKLDGPAL